jgi:hypothetical protein
MMSNALQLNASIGVGGKVVKGAKMVEKWRHFLAPTSSDTNKICDGEKEQREDDQGAAAESPEPLPTFKLDNQDRRNSLAIFTLEQWMVNTAYCIYILFVFSIFYSLLYLILNLLKYLNIYFSLYI